MLFDTDLDQGFATLAAANQLVPSADVLQWSMLDSLLIDRLRSGLGTIRRWWSLAVVAAAAIDVAIAIELGQARVRSKLLVHRCSASIVALVDVGTPVVGPLAELLLVNTDDLGRLAGAEGPNSWDVVEDEHDGECDTSSPGGGCKDPSNLLCELVVVVVEPSTGDLEETIVVGDGSLSKETCQDEADIAGEGVDGKDIHGVIAAHEDLQAGGKVGNGGGQEANQDSCRHTDEATCRSDGDETGNGTGTETDDGPLAFKAVVEEKPCDTGDRGGQVGGGDGHSSSKGSGEAGATVEAEPSEPQESGTEDDVGDVVWLEEQPLCAVSTSLSEVVGDDETSDTGADLDGTTASVVEDTPIVGPTLRRPDPVCDWIVDEGSPDEGKDDKGPYASSLTGGTNGNGWYQRCEHALVNGVDDLWQSIASPACWSIEDAHETKVAKVSEESSSGGRKSEGEAPEEPLEARDCETDHSEEEHVQCVLTSGETRVEVTQTRDHEPNEGSTCEDPRHVAR